MRQERVDANEAFEALAEFVLLPLVERHEAHLRRREVVEPPGRMPDPEFVWSER
jgi:hypothetical protein